MVNNSRDGLRGAEGARPPYFLQSLVFFCNQFEELQTVLFEVELIINHATLIYVYPNTMETWLTSNNLFIDRQLLYSSNIAYIGKINASIIIFGIRGDVVNLHETQRTLKISIISPQN